MADNTPAAPEIKSADKKAAKPKRAAKSPSANASAKPEGKVAKKPAAAPDKGKGKVMAQKAEKPARPAADVKTGAAEKPGKPKQKLVRDSFTLPRADFDLIQALKERALDFRHPAKKSEVVRAGLHALAALDDVQLRARLEQLVPLKPGRPKKGS